ncbi:MAG: HAD domain-containing protein [Gemmatimonadota bacterium]
MLHPDPCFDSRRMFEQVPRLAAVLAEFPEARVVLTTSWRSQKTLAELCEPLGPTLAARVAGATPFFAHFSAPARYQPYPRHAECLQWLAARSDTGAEWIALDDRASLFAPDCDRLIECDSSRGLDDSGAGRLRFALLRARRALELRSGGENP